MDLKELIRDQLLLRYAKSLQGDVYLLYGNTMDSITMQTVHSMVNLDGYSLSTICNPSTLYTYPDSHVHVGSALGELTTREIVLYCHYKNLQYQPGVSLFLRPEPSVYHLIMGAAEGSWVMRRSRGIATGRLRLHAAHCDRNGGEAEANDGNDSVQAVWEVGVWGGSERQTYSQRVLWTLFLPSQGGRESSLDRIASLFPSNSTLYIDMIHPLSLKPRKKTLLADAEDALHASIVNPRKQVLAQQPLHRLSIRPHVDVHRQPVRFRKTAEQRERHHPRRGLRKRLHVQLHRPRLLVHALSPGVRLPIGLDDAARLLVVLLLQHRRDDVLSTHHSFSRQTLLAR